MVKRDLVNAIKTNIDKIPAIAILGPRQSGKTTLTKELFPNYNYCNLEDYENREFAENDPKGFLKQFSNRVIFDEIQNVPKLFSYIQVEIDKQKMNGRFILTGSQNFSLLKNIRQSLAGRILLFNLLPFTIGELKKLNISYREYEQYIFKGFYPRIYNEDLNHLIWLNSYIQTYVERDIKNILSIKDLFLFQKFIKLCAGRIGQPVNYTSLANDTGISDKTAKIWLNLLEASFITFSLFPYYQNFNKRIIKAPKIYFYDIGLASRLLNINSMTEIKSHYLKGGLFENMIIMDIVKNYHNRGIKPEIYFWKEKSGKEIDIIIFGRNKIIPIEIKSSMTFTNSFLDNLKYFKTFDTKYLQKSILMYGGSQKYIREEVQVLGWQHLSYLYSIL